MFKVASAAMLLALTGSAQSAITVYTGHDGSFVPVDTAIFDDTVLGGGGTTDTQPGIDTHGINVTSIHVNEGGGFWGYDGGGDGTVDCYFNGGQNDIMSVTKLDGTDFNTIEMQVGNGFGANPQYIWVRAFNNGGLVDEFNVDLAIGGILGMTGGGYDEFRIAVYNDPTIRDQRVETNYSAGSIDNFGWNDPIPAPGAAALLGLAGIAAGRRRR
jgi:MYXO-CTERM domain-containing protein